MDGIRITAIDQDSVPWKENPSQGDVILSKAEFRRIIGRTEANATLNEVPPVSGFTHKGTLHDQVLAGAYFQRDCDQENVDKMLRMTEGNGVVLMRPVRVEIKADSNTDDPK